MQNTFSINYLSALSVLPSDRSVIPLVLDVWNAAEEKHGGGDVHVCVQGAGGQLS